MTWECDCRRCEARLYQRSVLAWCVLLASVALLLAALRVIP